MTTNEYQLIELGILSSLSSLFNDWNSVAWQKKSSLIDCCFCINFKRHSRHKRFGFPLLMKYSPELYTLMLTFEIKLLRHKAVGIENEIRHLYSAFRAIECFSFELINHPHSWIILTFVVLFLLRIWWWRRRIKEGLFG